MSPARWAHDLGIGVRLVVAGGRPAWVRAALTAVGISLGVAVLLAAASLPAMVDRASQRSAARTIAGAGDDARPGPRTFLVRTSDTTYRGNDIRGRDLRAEGRDAPVPPGLRTIPSPGTIVVSPALAALLRGPDGAGLRARLDARVVGRVGPAGLRGPRELVFYRGRADLRTGPAANAVRADAVGSPGGREPLGPLLTLLLVIAVVVLLLPVVVFVAGAVRFGGEDRDRRLAAIRLVGADRAMTARIAAGEHLVAAGGGVVLGAVLFVAARPLVEHISLQRLSVFTSDVRPSAGLAAAIVVGVPLAAVLASVAALRRIVVEPLGVVRHASATRRRLSWRLIPCVAGILVLLGLRGRFTSSDADLYQAAAGTLLTLAGITVVVPWLLEATVRRMGGAGTLSWQLAMRRLQMDGGTAARVVSGIAVAVAGAIALQSLFSVAERDARIDTGADPTRAQVAVSFAGVPATVPTRQIDAALSGARGVRSTVTTARVSAADVRAPTASGDLVIGSCRALRELAGIRRCRDGDVFATPPEPGSLVPRPGADLRLGDEGGPRPRWRVPGDLATVRLRPDPQGDMTTGLLATPGALAGVALGPRAVQSFVVLDSRDPDAIEQVRTAAARLDPSAGVNPLQDSSQDRTFAQLRRVIFAGATCVLALIGASLLLGAVEQMRERRKVLAVLVAFGTRRGTLAASVLWQAALPVVLGLGVALAVGSALGALLLSVASEPVDLNWSAALALTGVGAAVVGAVTLASLPALWRGMRPDGLRTE